MIESGFLVLVLLGGMIAFAMGRRGAVRSRRRKFEAREAISNDVWLSLNDSTDAATVLAIVDVFSEDLQVPKDHLYPTDRFDRELRLSGLFLIDEIVTDDLLSAVKDHFGEVKWDDNWETVADAVDGFAVQVQERSRSNGTIGPDGVIHKTD